MRVNCGTGVDLVGGLSQRVSHRLARGYNAGECLGEEEMPGCEELIMTMGGQIAMDSPRVIFQLSCSLLSRVGLLCQQANKSQLKASNFEGCGGVIIGKNKSIVAR
ncbi:hypothetical protein IFM89_001489 [Coptis chinensis]|uniref:Uncharacterized protein n=1 Tax=Coptis chinensis TaxID=261450 RepID=A0A835LQ95_9MAGN|nr:hypothetical protein IFM89_001489 [Coptis chinensis]